MATYTPNGQVYGAAQQEFRRPLALESSTSSFQPPVATQNPAVSIAMPAMTAAPGQSQSPDNINSDPEFLEFMREMWSKYKDKGAKQIPEFDHDFGGSSVMDPSALLMDSSGFSATSDWWMQPHPQQNQGQPSMSANLQASISGTYNGSQQPNSYNKANMTSERVNIIGTETGRRRRSRSGTAKRQAIHQSTQAGNIQAVEMFIRKDPDCVHSRTGEGLTPLWLAVQGGYFNIVKLLISHDVDIDMAEKEDGRAPMHQAAQNGHSKIVKLLLDRGAEHDPVDNHGLTPLWSAAQNGCFDIVKLILEKQPTADLEAESNDGGRRPIHQAAQGGYLNIVSLLLEKGAQADPTDNAGITPLWSAAQQGHHETVELLADNGAQVDVASNEGARQPMHQAAQNGNLETVKVLIAAGANPTPEDNSFDTDTPSPFWLACAAGKPDVVRLLLEHNANVHFVLGLSGKTTLHAAAYGGRPEIGELLLDNNCNIDAKEEKGWTALMLAAQEGHLDFLEMLLKKGANINAAEKDGATALWIASQQGHVQIVRCLLKFGAKQLPTRSASRRPMHQAAQNGHLSVLKLLLQNSPEDINSVDKRGATPLLLASQENKPNYTGVIKFLLNSGAKPCI
ncbi:Ankyrin-3 [Madurella mycetomatis]|uniref:Ankyrin-3 n=1 Tax=Madurella mycetomatis TaxID=100816 RepID=A0A175VUF5_9PEZI|nr:Ankyrin-3 [Madurella mycetomatis]